MQFGHDRAQERRIGGLDGARDLLDEFAANFAIFVAHRKAVEHGGIGRGATSICSAMPRLAGLTEWMQLV